MWQNWVHIGLTLLASDRYRCSGMYSDNMEVNIGASNGLVPSDKKPLHEPMLAISCGAIYVVSLWLGTNFKLF